MAQRISPLPSPSVSGCGSNRLDSGAGAAGSVAGIRMQIRNAMVRMRGTPKSRRGSVFSIITERLGCYRIVLILFRVCPQRPVQRSYSVPLGNAVNDLFLEPERLLQS